MQNYQNNNCLYGKHANWLLSSGEAVAEPHPITSFAMF